MADTNPARAFDALSHAFDRISSAQARIIGEAAIAIVVTRTKAGYDADGRLFVPYTPQYAAKRMKAGLQTRVDLAVKGHMLGAMIPEQTAPDEITVTFSSAREGEKAAAHNYGVNSGASVPAHSRSVYINKKGQRASSDEIARDRKRKNKQLTERTEHVTPHSRNMRIPQREFLDIRQPAELEVLANAIEEQIAQAFDQVA